ISRDSSGTHDSEWTGDSGNEPPKFSRSATCGYHVRSSDLFSSPANVTERAAARPAFAKVECDPSWSRRRGPEGCEGSDVYSQGRDGGWWFDLERGDECE